MFAEDVVLSALKEQSSWFIGDHLLRHENRAGDLGELAREIADRNELRLERVDDGTQQGYRFSRME